MRALQAVKCAREPAKPEFRAVKRLHAHMYTAACYRCTGCPPKSCMLDAANCAFTTVWLSCCSTVCRDVACCFVICCTLLSCCVVLYCALLSCCVAVWRAGGGGDCVAAAVAGLGNGLSIYSLSVMPDANRSYKTVSVMDDDAVPRNTVLWTAICTHA